MYRCIINRYIDRYIEIRHIDTIYLLNSFCQPPSHLKTLL